MKHTQNGPLCPMGVEDRAIMWIPIEDYLANLPLAMTLSLLVLSLLTRYTVLRHTP